MAKAEGAAPLEADFLSSARLSGQQPPPEPPIRATLFGLARFEQHGRSLAATHEVVPTRRFSPAFYPRVRDNVRMLQRARALLERHAREGLHLGPAAHWLLDNANLLDEQLQTVRQSLPRTFFRLLPRLRGEPLAGLPRIYGVAWAWVAHTDSGLDLVLLEAYLRAYQEERALTLAELWALPSTLRVVLIENLRRLAERIALQQVARDLAHQWLDQADELRGTAALDAVAAQLEHRGALEAFLLQLQQREDDLPAEQSLQLQAWLSLRLPDGVAAQARQQSATTEDHQSIRNAITSLRALDRVDWRGIFERSCAVMQLMAMTPVHAQEREDCQDDTLHAIERLARRSGHSEAQVARTLVALCVRGGAGAAPSTAEAEAASAPAYWWQGAGAVELHRELGLPPPRWQSHGRGWRRAATGVYLGGLTALVFGGVAWLLHRHADASAAWPLLALTGLLLLGPVGEAVVAVVNRWISESARPTRMRRLALTDGIPPAHRVLVVMPCMLGSAGAVQALAAQLEQHHVANAEAQAQFALLSDWADADAATLNAAATPAEAAVLDAARAAIEALNLAYPPFEGAPPRFLLLHRERRWSESEQRCIGWERKRGKLEQLVRVLAVPGDSPFLDLGRISQPAPGTRYIVTLDSDTVLPPGALRALVGVAAHPLNLPRLDANADAGQRRVVAGYGILQPKVEAPLPASEHVTWFHALFAGQGGIDPYSAASSEIYQDIFGEGTFTGKGLLHVQAVHATLAGRLPEGQVLSHDLLEGSLARCAGVGDISLVEDLPVHADVAHSRLHRWTRGDWQLLPFLLQPARWAMPLINRWKMLDNLRRSLVAPMSLALLLLVLATGVLPLAWALGVVAAAFCAGPLLGAVAALAPSRDDISLRLFFGHALADVARALAGAAWHVALLLQQTLMFGDAIVRALWRQFFSRRHLLAWTTADAAQAAASTQFTVLVRTHRRVPATALALAAAAVLAQAGGVAVHAAVWPLLLLWAAAPLWIALVSQPRPRPRREQLDDGSRAWLRGLARDTWRYYERHVTAEDHHLPPDNVQHTPTVMVAHRTSPTNIGMYLLSAVSAQALGFIGRQQLVQRLSDTLHTLEKLPRHRGHFHNWIDTRTLAVLAPAYVSTVDSGNCSAHLLAVAQACLQLANAPQGAAADGALQACLNESRLRVQALRPLLDSASSMRALAEVTADFAWPQDAAGLQALQARLNDAVLELDSLHIGRTHDSDSGADDGGDSNGNNSGHTPSSGGHDSALWKLRDHVVGLQALLLDLQADDAALRAGLRSLAARCRTLALQADFSLLYDRQRRLLHIGWRVDSQQLDDSHYDLLASESRLTSLLAIGKGDVPAAHWAALGRPTFGCGSEVGLKSWSGSMFEYLMPTLVLDEPIGSLLHQATRSAVRAQQAESDGRGTPWGISESAIAGQDHTLAYQYGPQGVARLALRRTPADERVIAPYASAMALVLAPAAALANLQALQALGARRGLGFIEAIDYTPQRQVAGSTSVAVHTFMAHHLGMTLVALTDVLTEGAPRRWAMADPVLRATAVLLHERAPREVPLLKDPPPLPPPRRTRGARLVADVQPLSEALAATQLLSNGRHAVVLRSHGGGHSQWEGLGITRSRDDLLRDDQGTWFYLRRSASQPWHSLSAHPAPDPAAQYSARLQADRTVFEARWPGLQTRCSVWISPEDDCELREVLLINNGRDAQALELASYAEITLAPLRADESHPAFSNLFVQARWDAAEQALHFRRKPRLPGEEPVRAVHFLALADGALAELHACADRARWLGRYGSTAQPLGNGGLTALQADAGDPDGAEPGVAVDTGLDPIASLRVRVRVPPGGQVRLTFCTAASRSLETLAALIDKYRQRNHPARASSMSHTMAGIRLRELNIDTDTWGAMLRVNTLLTSLAHREQAAPLRADASGTLPRCDRRVLWRHGISGDRPLLLLTIAGEDGLALVQTLKRALRLYSTAGLGVDLVVLNAEPPSYLAPVQHQLMLLHERLKQYNEHLPAERRGALHVLNDNTLHPDERHTLQTLARLRLHADGRSLAQQIDRLVEDHVRDRARIHASLRLPVLPRWPQQQAPGAPHQAPGAPEFRFSGELSDVVFEVSPQSHPARPWINVLANPGFGAQLSEVGSGMVWAGNSRMHQIVGWSNDALGDPPAEWLLLHDLDTRRVWPLGQALLDGGPGSTREVTHGLGCTRMRQTLDGLDVTLQWCVDAHTSVRQLQVRVVQASGRPRRLRLVAVAEWTMGAARSERFSVNTSARRWQPHAAGVGLAVPDAALALQATQLDHLGGFGMATAFLAWRPPQPGDAEDPARSAAPSGGDEWTCDRRELYDGAGRLVLPTRLGRTQGTGLDPCAALALQFDISPERAVSATLLLGHAASPQAASALLAEAWAVQPEHRLARQRQQWHGLLAPVQVRTPDAAFDALANHWLPYQTVVCRLWARAGFYQAGGAYGFRDQLQDAMAMVSRAPQMLAAQIRLNATRQFAAGDVQHWWHAPGGAGVRTHFSDDLLWLPLALVLYVQRTGDAALLDEPLPFLQGSEIPAGQEDIYETPQATEERASLYEHAARAIDRSVRGGAGVGRHGLPLFGTGDWNDGMNRVGHEGRGESVWLAWFLCSVVDGLLPIARQRGDDVRVAAWTAARAGWVSALESAGWDGAWYRRGYFDDGSPLGSAQNHEARIDLVAQAWAVLSGAGDAQRARQAMASAAEHLVDPQGRLVRLLHPPLQHAQPNAGYIQSYPPGVRENGGQYNHAAVWALMAFAELGQPASAWQVYTMLSPAHRLGGHGGAAGSAKYALEPYVMAGDIYTQPPFVGRGGWSWYTGSAGWLARASVESICGVVLDAKHLVVRPALPPHWPQAEVRLQRDGRSVRVLVCGDLAQQGAALARHPGARTLAPGVALAWADLADGDVIVVPAATSSRSARDGAGPADQGQRSTSAPSLAS